MLLQEGFYGKPPLFEQFGLINKFNYTFRYLDDISTIDNPGFTYTYPKGLQLNKAKE